MIPKDEQDEEPQETKTAPRRFIQDEVVAGEWDEPAARESYQSQPDVADEFEALSADMRVVPARYLARAGVRVQRRRQVEIE